MRVTKLRKLVYDSDKVKILKLKAQGIRHEFIAKRFGLAVSTVSGVK